MSTNETAIIRIHTHMRRHARRVAVTGYTQIQEYPRGKTHMN
jgi:hypothetical protein